MQALRGVYDYALQILMYEITGRCFHYIERSLRRGGVTRSLTTSFRSVSYNNVPTDVRSLRSARRSWKER